MAESCQCVMTPWGGQIGNKTVKTDAKSIRDRAREDHRGGAARAKFDRVNLSRQDRRTSLLLCSLCSWSLSWFWPMRSHGSKIVGTPTLSASARNLISPARNNGLSGEQCLEATQTRTHWFWHVLYGVGLL
jgi:hypothetical protein